MNCTMVLVSRRRFGLTQPDIERVSTWRARSQTPTMKLRPFFGLLVAPLFPATAAALLAGFRGPQFDCDTSLTLGQGLPLFSELAAPARLELTSSKAFPGGAVAQVYRPV